MITRDYSDKDLRAALGSSPPLEKMKMAHTPTKAELICDALDHCEASRADHVQGICGCSARQAARELITDSAALITELVGALEPFADVPIDMLATDDQTGKTVSDDTFTRIEVLGIGGPYEGVIVSHFRRARAALLKARAHGGGV